MNMQICLAMNLVRNCVCMCVCVFVCVCHNISVGITQIRSSSLTQIKAVIMIIFLMHVISHFRQFSLYATYTLKWDIIAM